MLCKPRTLLLIVISTCFLGGFAGLAVAAAPTAAQALRLKPIQSEVNYDTPEGPDVAQCKVHSRKEEGVVGWIVFDGGGRVLRRFLDTNADNKVDQWLYYKDAVEVYRDIDTNFNGKADEYRWLGTEGTRWGLDRDEDGVIDTWKMISPEEVTAEVVAALREGDSGRFARLLLTPEELASLGLGEKQRTDLKAKIATARTGFKELARRQKLIEKTSLWVHFGASRPGVSPAGTDGSTKDLIVYENVVAVVNTSGNHGHLGIGTLVQVGQNWRVVDLPKTSTGDQVATNDGFFFQASLTRRPEVETVPEGGLSREAQKLIADYEATEKALETASTPQQRSKLNARRDELFQKLAAAAASPEDRANWIRQHADTLSAAVQSGSYTRGIARLKELHDSLAQEPADAELAAYVKFRYLSGQYSQNLQQPKADYAKIQEQWLQDLRQFVKDHPQSSDAAEAMLQLALAQEFAGQESEAKVWYGRIVNDFPTSPLAKKAAGAQRRLDLVGKTLVFRGKTLAGKTIDLSAYRGKVTLIHYWATWCEPCKQDLKTLRSAQAKYGRRGFELIGVSVDSDRETLARYLNSSRLSWPQLYEEGGLDSRLASELGVLTLPIMILVDAQGKVISRNLHAAELESELSKHLR